MAKEILTPEERKRRHDLDNASYRNSDRGRAYTAEWRNKNRERIKAYREENREKFSQRQKE